MKKSTQTPISTTEFVDASEVQNTTSVPKKTTIKKESGGKASSGSKKGSKKSKSVSCEETLFSILDDGEREETSSKNKEGRSNVSEKKETPHFSPQKIAKSKIQNDVIEEKEEAKNVKKTVKRSAAKKIKAIVVSPQDDDVSNVPVVKKSSRKRSVKKTSTEQKLDVDKPQTIGSKRKNKSTDSSENLAGTKEKKTVKTAVKARSVSSEPSLWETYRTICDRIERVSLSKVEKDRRAAHTDAKRQRCLRTEYEDAVLPYWEPGWLVIQGARQHNLKSIDVPFPLSAFSVVTGVSGSGKSSLVEDVLYRYLARVLNHTQAPSGTCDGIVGYERINKVVQVDQSPIGQSPSSNAATFTGVFDLIRQLFAQLPEAKLRGYSPRRFSFNVPGGRCEKCEGAGLLKVEMHFLADVWITCDACGGKRYDSDTLQVKYHGKSIADVLETTCGDALKFFGHIPPIAQKLRTLCDVGLDYLPLGQSATTLSGGEAQRVKLAAELSRIDSGRTLYVLDEPTTGLHFEDIRKLLDVLHRLVDLGNTVVVIEHNLDVIKNADWIVEIGPEAGFDGGRLVFAGTPEQLLEYTARRQVASVEERQKLLQSHTGESLFSVFQRGIFEERVVVNPQEYWSSLKTSTIEAEDLNDESDEENVTHPWEIDGRRWHMEFRKTRSGLPCKWDSRVLSSIVDRLEECSTFAETDWNNRTTVEIRSERRTSAWFMRATTNEEWLLHLKFRTAKNTFDRNLLTRKLALKPLKEIEEIPLYGSQPRVRLETNGLWQEVDLKVFCLAEIDRPEFWNFLKLAAERFTETIESFHDNSFDSDSEPLQGRDWHFSSIGFRGKFDKPVWSIELLKKILSIVEKFKGEDDVNWAKKDYVAIGGTEKTPSWLLIFTKNSEYLYLQLNYPKGRLPTKQVEKIGFEPEIDVSNEDWDTAYLRFRSDDDLNQDRLTTLLEDAHGMYLDVCSDEDQ